MRGCVFARALRIPVEVDGCVVSLGGLPHFLGTLADIS